MILSHIIGVSVVTIIFDKFIKTLQVLHNDMYNPRLLHVNNDDIGRVVVNGVTSSVNQH